MIMYRLRINNGRVIGPFNKTQLFELRQKGHIKGLEEAQVFPTGNWGPLKKLEFYDELMDENKTIIESKSKDETFVLDISKIRSQKNEKMLDEIDLTHHTPIDPLTETIRIESAHEPKVEIIKEPSVLVKIELDQKNEDSSNKTIINPVAQQEIERMRREQKKLQEKSNEEKKIIEEKRLRELEEEEARKELALKPIDESTQMIKIDSIKESLLERAQEEDQKIELEVKAIKKKKKIEEQEEESDSEEEENTTNNKKRKKVIIMLAAVAIFYAILFPEEDKKEAPKFVHLNPEIVFPVPFDKADEKKALVEFNKGKELFDSGSYPDLVKAGVHFKNSYENNIENVDSSSYLVRTYAEELKYSKDPALDSQTLFNIIQVKKPFLMKNPNGVIGLNLFYTTIKKHEAAADVVAKYLKINAENVTEDLFAVYVHSLIEIGKIDLAKSQFIAPLVRTANKSRYVLDALIEYYLLNQEFDEADTYIDDGIKRFPNLVRFYLDKAERLIDEKSIKEVEPLLKKVEELGLEKNDLERAKYFEIRGLLSAAEGKVKEATDYLTRSLQLSESTKLREKLADLETTKGADKKTDNLISESKAVKFLKQAKEFYEKRNFDFALSAAIKAVDEAPDHIDSSIFLSRVQLRLGLAEQGLKTLEELIKKYPEDKSLNFALLSAYVDSYKFSDAKNRVSIISSTPLKNNYEYYSFNARIYMKMGDSLQAIGWLKNSISLNPLNDQDIFYLAEILIKRANFDGARSLINKCIELDPVNMDYRIAYAKILYEVQDDQAAIGYLLNVLTEFGDNPKLLSEIAIFYYRAGRVKDFEAFKSRIEKLPSKDRTLYDFLIRMALLDERYEEVPRLVEQLLKVEPGDLESMMTAGRILFEDGKLVEAAQWFERVKRKLPTYPKVQYYIAKMKFLAGEIDDPKDESGAAKLDINKKPMRGALSIIQDDIKTNGENDASLVLLAEIYYRQDKILEAENTYKKAQKINPKSYDALMGMADISTKRNNFDLALDLYKKAMKEKGDDPNIHKKIGDVYRLLGQGALAMESYKMYLEMNPDATDKKQIEAYIQLMQ